MKKKIALMIFMLLALVMLGCSSDQSGFVENNGNDSEESTDQGSDNSGLGGLVGMVRVPVLFGIAGGPHAENLVKQGGSTSSLYLINTSDGSATLIGDTGYHLTSIAYCYITNQLYGITSSSNGNINVESNYKNGTSSHSLLITINPVTGAGTAITELTLDLATAKTVMERSLPASVNYIQETGFGSMTINLFGTLVVWTHIYYSYDNNYTDGALFSTINPLTGVVTPFSFFYGGCYEGSIAFNNSNVLYLMNRYYQPYVNTINMQDGTITYQGAIDNGHSDPYRYYHGDFHPLTGKFWSIDKNSIDGYQKNLLEQKKFRFNELIVFIDISDIQDEIIYDKFEPATIPLKTMIFYKVRKYLERNSVIYFSLINPVKITNPGIEFDRNIFPQLNESYKYVESPQYLKERSEWTLDPGIYERMGKKGLALAEKHMDMLFHLCRQNNIRLSIAVYPWPVQIARHDINGIQEKFWRSFCERRGLKFIDLFPLFINKEDPKKIYMHYFIYGDDHWNREGHKLVAGKVLESLKDVF